jgi:2-methylcitrate dehydratase PrpD
MEKREAKITEEVSNFVAAARYDDFPAEAQHIAKRCVIDGVGVILAGSTEPCTRIIRDYVLSAGGKKESSILGKGKAKAPAHLAALVNATAGHAMDWDDTALSNTPDRAVLLHPTGPALAAGLAIGEQMGLGGRDLLTGFLVGFEVECKIAEAMHSDHFYRGFHSSGTLAILGATSMAAKLMGLPAKQVRSALGIATRWLPASSVNHGTMTKPARGALCENGIVSANSRLWGLRPIQRLSKPPRVSSEPLAENSIRIKSSASWVDPSPSLIREFPLSLTLAALWVTLPWMRCRHSPSSTTFGLKEWIRLG